jgi:uridine phosphorylase
MEELARAGATTFIRIGTCGTFQDRVHTGDMAIFDSAARYDGASRLYAPIEFPAVASHEVVAAAIEAGERLGYPFHVGTTRSADTFYAMHPRPGSSFNDYWQSAWREHFDDLKRLNVVAAEMEASVILVLARIWGLRAGGIAVVLDNVLRVSGDSGEFDPQEQFDHGGDEIERLARMGSEIVRIVAERDAASERAPAT